MRTEDIKTKNDDYNFIEDLKIKRENQMKETSNKEGEDIAKDTLFDKSSTVKEDDMTPIMNTDVELEYEIRNIPINNKEQVFIYEDLSFDANNNINELSYNQPLLLTDKKTKAKEEAKIYLLNNNSEIINNEIINNNPEKISKAKKKRQGRKKAKEEPKKEGDFFELSRIPEKNKKLPLKKKSQI
jgi:hypothetical protein